MASNCCDRDVGVRVLLGDRLVYLSIPRYTLLPSMCVVNLSLVFLRGTLHTWESTALRKDTCIVLVPDCVSSRIVAYKIGILGTENSDCPGLSDQATVPLQDAQVWQP